MFPVEQGSGHARDFTLAAASTVNWFMNEWQSKLISGAPAVGPPQDAAEQRLFSCTPFAADEPTWEEASSRIIYTALNLHMLDTGSTPNYGQVTPNHAQLRPITPASSPVYAQLRPITAR